MHDWTVQLDVILKMNKRELLDHAGKISHQKMLEKVDIGYNDIKRKQK
jgi:hypothetical protein